MAMIQEPTPRERAWQLQGFIAGVRAKEQETLSDVDRDALDHFAVITEQMLTGGAFNPMHVFRVMQFIDSIMPLRSDILIEAAHAAADDCP